VAISHGQRERIAARGAFRCEYCLLHQDYAVKRHEPDHVIPKKHGGSDADENLAWACFQCNRHKGSEVGAVDLDTGHLVRLFNPRQQNWADHFVLDGARIIPLTGIGRVTELVLQFNRPEQLAIREVLIQAGLYPV
jgi:5-methylcytosine-specific restriction endonuclease McrA